MRFKRLEMVGFKSFVDRTVIEVGDQLTAVVGPNGCGKSNFADAIRWVLGEQAPRALRAKRMEDVIFNGSAERKPLGMAEVSLTISDLKGVVTAPAYKDYEELVVTRRLYRSGESEYLINRNPCRLKDITDLFLDTGVSLDGFSLIEQGRIEDLVNAKPLERRLFIEEAAGIMKYKNRRNEALRKLDLAQANLLRVSDIMREKESRLRSLRRQARKATFFKEYTKEVQELELLKLSLDYLRLESELEPIESQYARQKEEEQALAATLAARDAEREQCRIEIAERSEALAEIRRRAVETEGILQRLENRLEMLSGRLVELDAEDERRREEMKTLAEEADRLAEENRRLASLEEQLSGEILQAQRQFDRKAEELDSVRRELAVLEEAFADSRRVQAAESETLSRARQRVAFSESQREGVGRALERVEREAAEARRILGEARREEESAAQRLEDISRAEGRQRVEAKRLAAERARLEGLLREAEERLSAEREALVEIRSSLQVFEQFDSAAAADRAGVSAFRECGAEVLGGLADFLIVDPRYEKAIEAALGERLLGVVVRDARSAAEAVRALIRSGAGRGLVLPLESRRPPAEPIPDLEGVLGPAADLVRCGEAHRSLVEGLLAGIGVAENLDAAQRAWRQGPEGTVWVTLDGEVVLPQGGVEGGSADPARAGLLENARRAESLRAELEEGEKRLLEREASLARRRADLARAETESEEALRCLREAELARVETEERLRSSRDKRGRAEERCRLVDLERTQVLGESEKLEREFAEAKEEGERAGAAKAGAEDRAAEAEASLKEIGARAAAIESVYNELRVALTEVQGRLAGVRAERQRLEEAISQNEARRRRRAEETEDAEDKRAHLHLNLEQSREEISRRREEKTAIEAEQSRRARELEETRARDEELRERLRTMRAELGDRQARLGEFAEQRTTLRVKREGMVEDARAAHGVSLPEVAETNRPLLPQYQEHANRLEMLRQRLSRMGEVNPLAAREYDEIHQEFSFLQENREDLEKSIADLHATIDKLNRTTRKRFLEAFEQVSANFEKTFSRLFQGGEARMYMIDPNDPLETGVDIEVRPPGKRPGNILLLSAGEKALTAIALLFAVFSVRPSPFCLLDEVDATLDDANVGRFREILADLEDRTQFLIVTHNKKTMSYASHLYGVTQREKGVSVVVSVKLNHREVDGAGNGAPVGAQEAGPKAVG